MSYNGLVIPKIGLDLFSFSKLKIESEYDLKILKNDFIVLQN